MALKYQERVQETTTSTGTGNLSLSGAPNTSYQEFGAVLADGDETDVAIFSDTEFEVRRCTYVASGDQIARSGLIYASSNSGNAVSFGAGIKTAVMMMPGQRAFHIDRSVVALSHALHGAL